MKEVKDWMEKTFFFDSRLTGLGTGYIVTHGTRRFDPSTIVAVDQSPVPGAVRRIRWSLLYIVWPN